MTKATLAALADQILKTAQAPKKRKVRRNWEAQRRYDEEHGTDNGYDTALEERLAMHRREM